MNLSFLVVGIIWFGAVAIGRRVAPELSWRHAIAFYLVVLVFLFRPLTSDFVNLPVDFLPRLTPWETIESAKPKNPTLNDIVLQFVPWSHQVRDSWLHGRVPLWTTEGGGYPLLGNGQSEGLSVFMFLTLVLPLWQSFAAEAALKLLLALAFAYLWSRRRGFSDVAALVTSLSYTFSSAIIVWLYFPHAAAAVFIPCAFYLIDLVAERPTALRIAAFGIASGLLFLAGHPEIFVQIAMVCTAYLLFRVFTGSASSWRRVLPAAALGLTLGVCLAAPRLIPITESIPLSQRYERLHSGKSVIEVPRSPKLYGLLLQPRIFGDHDQRNWGPVHPEFVSGWAGVLGILAWFGIAVDVVRRRRWREPITFFVLAVPIALGIIFGWPVISTLFLRIPLQSLAPTGRWRIPLCWFLAVLAGGIVDTARDRVKTPLLVGTGVVAAFLIAMFVSKGFGLHQHGRFVLAVLAPGIATIAACLALMVAKRPLHIQVASAAIVFFLIVDLWSFDYGWNPVVKKDLFYPDTPSITALKKAVESDPIGPVRVAGFYSVFYPNVATMYGLEDVRPHDPMARERWLDYLSEFCGYSSSEYFGMLTRFASPFIDFANVRYVMVRPRQKLEVPGFRMMADGKDARIYVNDDAAPRFFAPRRVVAEQDHERLFRRLHALRDWTEVAFVGSVPATLSTSAEAIRSGDGKIEIARRAPARYRLTIQAGEPELIVGSLLADPAWRVRLNGSTTLATTVVDGAFLGFVVPPGHSVVDVSYRPRPFVAGVGLAGLALFGIAGLFTVGSRRSRGAVR